MIDWKEYKQRQNFYHTKEWSQTRLLKLHQNPLCEHCALENKLINATEIDHIIDIEDAPALRLDMSNLQSLCKSCHSKKTYKKVEEKLKEKKHILKPRIKWDVSLKQNG